MVKRKVLIQLDADRQPSVFDRIVALDAGADEVLSYGGVEPEEVEGLVHGAMFTRAPADLKNTAVFIGGRNVSRGEELLGIVVKTFFGPLRTSVMLDSSGANTTAAGAVLAARRHLDLVHSKALVLGGTGPVGQRVALLLARQKAAVWVGSRSLERAQDICNDIHDRYPDVHVYPQATEDAEVLTHQSFDLAVAAGAAGVRLLNREQCEQWRELRVLIDLNAVPPAGIEGVEPGDNGRLEEGIFHYGAIGIGGVKMKLHRACVARLFEANNLVLDLEDIYQIGLALADRS
jgi:hypothetical protein